MDIYRSSEGYVSLDGRDWKPCYDINYGNHLGIWHECLTEGPPMSVVWSDDYHHVSGAMEDHVPPDWDIIGETP